jgi:4-hydroxy-tetrahydrodipicolinate synthase
MPPVFRGVGVALLTLFHDDGAIDAPATAALAKRLVDAGVHAVVVAGTTGEAFALEADERVSLLGAVKAAVGARVPVIAGTGAPSARRAVALTRDAVDAGADAVLALSPAGAADVRQYYDEVAKAAGAVPVLGYHYPAVSPPGIPVPVLAELPIVGCKDSSGDPARLLVELDAFDGDLYTGSSWLLAYAGPLGCTGAILALANAEPERCVAAFAGDVAAQRALTPANVAAHEGDLKALTAARFGTSTVRRIA